MAKYNYEIQEIIENRLSDGNLSCINYRFEIHTDDFIYLVAVACNFYVQSEFRVRFYNLDTSERVLLEELLSCVYKHCSYNDFLIELTKTKL